MANGRPGPPKGVSNNPAGRKIGTKIKRTIMREKLQEKPKLKILDPIDFMLELLSDPSYGLANRQWAAKNAAPYIRSKMPIRIEETKPAEDLAQQLRQSLSDMRAITEGAEPAPTRRRIKLLVDL